ncbi:MAG: iron-containing alcohol dehydrogenase family protein [Pseudanabaena sp. SU_2_4]|nr:iron-containing alcohol dehydrogenase family protein [Pseudanabaena sp. SU_2_4]
MLAIAPAQLLRGQGIIAQLGKYLLPWGNSALVVAGRTAKGLVTPCLEHALAANQIVVHYAPAISDCTDTNLSILREAVTKHQATMIIGAGGGKALDAAKLIGEQTNLPVITIPTTAATCAAWTALSNVYSDEGAFSYDVTLSRCPNLMLVDYELITSAPPRTLVAGIGDAIAKWYEASISSGSSDRTMVIAAVQEARILRDILLQKSLEALHNPGSDVWREVVDATVCLAGVIGGIGGAQCRTVAAHAVHNGLTHLPQVHHTLHGEKVAYGILVQLRLEEFQGNQLAATARHQLLKFYDEIGLPKNLAALGLADVTLRELETVAAIACLPESDIHHLPFTVAPSQLVAAMVSTTVPIAVSCEK